ncbi:arylsulfatase [Arenibacter sp. ARW7G5Y1]|uniref:arylsulfatase n=1 Tax=Arenibacter sp. ARW7G5Y1 TaxID=2135619 RepID=UPI000D7658A4|nr:arylsulfatase [Arenibacter sp. ARW7G5Y1]PXX25426.1 arylsulfatase A-like enzyme [Arenibacter sp. ARW7G5Y1]
MGKLKNILLVPVFVMALFSCKEAVKSKVSKVDGPKKPNVILIMTDDQGYGDLASLGSPYVKTPNLNKFYNESVRFTDFHVDPSCSPTRSALLTGNYSARAGVWHTIGGRSLLKEGMVTMADVFSDNGYKTAVFGKWHLGENYPFRPNDRGFQEAVVHGGGGIGQSPDYWGNDYYDDTYKHNGKFQKYKGYCNTVWFNEAIDYIEKNKDEPFFCYIPTNLPHAPLYVDEKYVEPFKGKVPERLAKYYGMVEKIDEDVATLFRKVKELALEENTIIIFMTDNGPCPWFGGVEMDFETGYVEEGYTAGMRGAKIWGYENAHRVPFFIRWPNGGIQGGKDIDALSAHIDVLPTLIELCDLKGADSLKMDGRSLMPLLNGKLNQWDDDRTVIVHNQRVEYPVKDKEYQVITKDWRLVNREEKELYNIKNDGGQRVNVVEENPEVVEELYKRYEDWWQDVSVGFGEYAKMYVGSEHENPVTLYSHDAHTRNGEKIWTVKVARDGRYEVEVNRWPKESGKKIKENGKGEMEDAIGTAFLKVGNIEQTVQLDGKMTSAKFVVDLKAGVTCFQSSFRFKGSDKVGGAGFVYVDYMGAGDAQKISEYVPSVPDDLLRKGYEQKVVLFD